MKLATELYTFLYFIMIKVMKITIFDVQRHTNQHLSTIYKEIIKNYVLNLATSMEKWDRMHFSVRGLYSKFLSE